jgi:mannose-1-phosphate guanylyltransferase
MHLVPAVLCGGTRSQLWPVSRELCSKPIVRLSEGRSLPQNVFLIGAALPDVQEILTVTSFQNN